MNAIERIARAMCPPNMDPDTLVFRERVNPPGWAPLGLSMVPKGIPLWMVYVEQVQRLLAAIREPSPEQVARMDKLLGDGVPPTRRYAWVWDEMIEALLAEAEAKEGSEG